MKIDLHIHTAASGDGEFSPQAIIEFAKARQLSAIAITDHDSVDSIEAALYYGGQHGIEVIPGCEFSTQYQAKWLHILGYYIDYQHAGIKDWCRNIQTSLEENVDLQIVKLREAGFYLEKEQVIRDGSQPMPVSYVKALFLDSRNDGHPLLESYRSQGNYIVRFCLDWIVTGRPYNSPREIPEAQTAINLILASGGVPVLAHPAATLTPDDDGLIRELMAFGIMGLEAFTTWHTPEQEAHYERFCREHRLLATCGSDFHGQTKPHIQLGQVKNNRYEVLERLTGLAQLVKQRNRQASPSGY